MLENEGVLNSYYYFFSWKGHNRTERSEGLRVQFLEEGVAAM